MNNRRGRICNQCATQHPGVKFRSYRRRARLVDIPFELTRKQFMGFWQKPCHYCGDEIDTIGLDQITPKAGYIIGNIVSCCFTCNQIKGEDIFEDFIARCHRIAKRYPTDLRRDST